MCGNYINNILLIWQIVVSKVEILNTKKESSSKLPQITKHFVCVSTTTKISIIFLATMSI